MRHLDLFSGIGGFALAAQWMGWQTVAFCEREKYARRVLEQHWPSVPIIDDITQWPSERIGCDIITGGFPCQPFSCAGLKRGQKDDRYLWPAMLAVIKQERPAWVVGENVFGIIKMALDQVLSDLEAIGYATRAFVVPACAVDAQHKRNRVWIVAHASSTRARHQSATIEKQQSRRGNKALRQRDGQMPSNWIEPASQTKAEALADSSSIQRQRMRQKSLFGEQDIQRQFGRSSQDQQNRWPSEPALGRVANGIPNRTHRIKGLGNAIVPQVAHQIFQFIEDFNAANSIQKSAIGKEQAAGA
jgi:DNA (cytosine-5)-methyltransferase 1